MRGACTLALPLTHSPSHTHTHSSGRDAGREGNLLAGGRSGLARVRVFSSHSAIWRPRGVRGIRDWAHSQLHTLGNRNSSHPVNFPSPLTPVPSPGGSRKRTGGRLFSARLKLVRLEAGAGWRTNRVWVRSWALGRWKMQVAEPGAIFPRRLPGASVVTPFAQVAPLSRGVALPPRALPVVSPSRQFGLDLRAQALLSGFDWRKLPLSWVARAALCW